MSLNGFGEELLSHTSFCNRSKPVPLRSATFVVASLASLSALLSLGTSARAADSIAVPSLSGAPPATGATQAAYPTPVKIPPTASAASAVPPAASTAQAAPPSPSGIQIPTPPPPSAFSSDPAQLAAQAEQAALQAQAQADSDEHKHEQEHIQKSFDRASNGLMPLTPDQIRDFMRRLERTQEAAQIPAEGTPKGQTRIVTLPLDPGAEPPQVELAAGFVTTIAVVDATGEPWPIMDVGVGGNFDVSPTQAGSHVVRIMPLTRVGTGDLSVILKDLPTPVIFRLSAGGPKVDLRYDARIAKPGPGAKPPLISRPRLQAGDETLTQILAGLPPADATKIKIGGLDTRTKAWSVGEKVYVRTPLALLSPAWNASATSADGMTVYEIGNAPVLLLSDNGAMVRAQILRDDDHDK